MSTSAIAIYSATSNLLFLPSLMHIRDKVLVTMR